MNTARILSFILLPLLTLAQAPAPYPVLVDSQRATVPALEVFQANAITFRASFKSGNTANAIVTESPFMYWQPYGATNATVVTANWSIVSAPSGTVDFAFVPADLNFTAGTYTYQVGLEQSGGPQVIKQGSFTIRPSQASIGASPIAFATTNVNWGLINWSGLPAYEYQTNTIAQVATLNASIATASNALSGQISAASNALNDRISTVSNSLFATSVSYSNALNAQIQAVNDASKWSQFQATQTVNMANNSITNAGNVQAVSINGDGAAISIPHIHGTLAGNIYIHIRNGTTNTIAKGTPVYVIGNVGAGDRKLVAPAQSGDPTKMPAIALAEANLTANADGDGVILGEIRTYNTVTNSWAINTELYVAPLGGLTSTAPTSGLVQSVGQVSRTNNINGIIVAQIQGAVLPKELFLASTTTFVAVESDPIFAAVSNSINTRITAVETGKVNLSVYTPATQALWTAIGNIVSADNALTNVTASGRIAAVKTGAQVALTFDASGLATGTPIYSVDGKLDSNTWAAADSTTNYASRITFNATSNSFNTRITDVEGYTNRAASALASSVWASADSTTNYQTRTGFISASNAINTRLVSVEGYTSRVVAVEAYTNRAALALASNIWASADSTTNYQTRTGFISASNAINGRLVAVEAYTSRVVTAESNITALQGYTNQAAAALASNVWASADSTTNYALRTTFVTATNALDNKFTNFLQLAGGTVVGDLRVQRSTTASTALVLTNSGSVPIGLKIDLPASGSTFLDLNGTNDKYTFTDTTANFHGNTITNAIVAGYLTVTGAAATYVNSTNLPAGIVTTNNLSTIAGSGLGVTSNRLVVTNVVSGFLASTGGVISAKSTYTVDHGFPANTGLIFNANQDGSILEISRIYGGAPKTSKRYTLINNTNGFLTVGSSARFSERVLIASESFGQSDAQFDALTNNVLLYVGGAAEFGGNISTTSGAFTGNAANLTNFPSSILTVSAGNTNYWRITTAPTGSTSSGSSGQMAVSGTNLFIYSPNALGVGTARWLRVSGSVSW